MIANGIAGPPARRLHRHLSVPPQPVGAPWSRICGMVRGATGRLGLAGFSLATWAGVTRTDTNLDRERGRPSITTRVSLAPAVASHSISPPQSKRSPTSWDTVRPCSAAPAGDFGRLREALQVTLRVHC